MAMIHAVIAFDPSGVAAEQVVIDHENLLSSPYRSTTWQHFAKEDGSASAGVWDADSCVERFVQPHDEFCHLLLGTVRLTDAGGATREFHAGQSFLVRKGFEGVWENVGRVRKAYVLF